MCELSDIDVIDADQLEEYTTDDGIGLYSVAYVSNFKNCSKVKAGDLCHCMDLLFTVKKWN